MRLYSFDFTLCQAEYFYRLDKLYTHRVIQQLEFPFDCFHLPHSYNGHARRQVLLG
jgi:hypothetical protein